MLYSRVETVMAFPCSFPSPFPIHWPFMVKGPCIFCLNTDLIDIYTRKGSTSTSLSPDGFFFFFYKKNKSPSECATHLIDELLFDTNFKIMASYWMEFCANIPSYVYLLFQVLLQQHFGLLLWFFFRAILLCSIREMVK